MGTLWTWSRHSRTFQPQTLQNFKKRKRNKKRTGFGPMSLSFPQFSDLICAMCLLSHNQTPAGNAKAPFLSLCHFSLWSNLCCVPSWSNNTRTPSSLQWPQTSSLPLPFLSLQVSGSLSFSLSTLFFFLVWLYLYACYVYLLRTKFMCSTFNVVP